MKQFRNRTLGEKSVHEPGRALFTGGWVLLVAVVSAADATEIRFRPQANVAESLVRLGHIADIVTNNRDQAALLAAVELFPAPLEGRTRLVRAGEIQDLLTVRAVDLAGVRLGGASLVRIQRTNPNRTVARASSRPSSAERDRLERAIRDAIREHLSTNVAGDARWTVDVHLTNAAVERLVRAGTSFRVTGGKPPWTGRQQFEITGAGETNGQTTPVQASVSLSTMVVVAARDLARGKLIQAADVRLDHAPSGLRTTDATARVDDVIGKQTIRSVTAGYPLDPRSVRSPILVHRGEVVRVLVQVANVKVTTSARALDEGGQGDLIEVQSLASREKYLAHVVGIQEVAVYPRRFQVAARPASRRAPDPVHALGSRSATATVRGASPRLAEPVSAGQPAGHATQAQALVPTDAARSAPQDPAGAGWIPRRRNPTE